MYKIPFINPSYGRYAKAHKEELLNTFWDCVENGRLILREDVTKFEDNFAKYLGAKYAIGVGSGTDALRLACELLGLRAGDEAITVGHTFQASIYCIVANGATPILIDIKENELMDVDKIEEAITPRTKIIIPVHFHGKVCQMDKILEIAKKYELKVIEDACQALGSTYKGRKAGTIGDVGCFSFNTPKLLGGWGDGGMIVTNDDALAVKFQYLRNHWNMAQTSVRMSDWPKPEVVHWAGKSRLDNVWAALLDTKLKYLDQLLARRKEIADKYTEGLRGLPLKTPNYTDEDVIQEYIVIVKDPEQRERFKSFMAEKGIELLIRETTPNHKVKNLGLDHFNLPVTERISNGAVRLPSYPELYDSEIEEIVQAIKDFYAGERNAE